MSTQSTHIRSAPPLRRSPELKIYRVGTPYPYVDSSAIAESAASAACAFLTAHYRIANGRIQRFNQRWLSQRIQQGSAWANLLDPYLMDLGVPFEPAENGTYASFVPGVAYLPSSLEEVLSLLAEVGPVLLCLPWSDVYNHQSRANGWDWIGPDGRDSRATYATRSKVVLLKGVAHKFNGVRVHDGARPDLWMPFAEIDHAFRNGALAFSAEYV